LQAYYDGPTEEKCKSSGQYQNKYQTWTRNHRIDYLEDCGWF